MKHHPVFERRGDDLYRTLNVSFPQATLGATLSVETLGGTERLKVPPGIDSGTLLKLKGSGMPKIHGLGYGDLYIQIQVKTPKKLSKRAQLLLGELQRELENEGETYK
jgi:molecular chaperone DnaJ